MPSSVVALRPLLYNEENVVVQKPYESEEYYDLNINCAQYLLALMYGPINIVLTHKVYIKYACAQLFSIFSNI